MVKASDWKLKAPDSIPGARRHRQDGRTAGARRLEIWILPHPEMEVFDSFENRKCDNCPTVKKIWDEIEKCLRVYYHPMAEQFMWVPGSGSWVFGEIGGLRKMSDGGRKLSIFKNVWEYFCQVGAVQISIF